MTRGLEQTGRCGDVDRIFGEVIALVDRTDDVKRYVRKELIPMMDERRGRPPLSGDEIVKKLFSIDRSKPGEAVELIKARKASRFKLTPRVALEIADIIYYCFQPNCPEFLKDPEPLIRSCGVNMETAFAFCFVKYHTRLLCGDLKNHKEIEEAVIERFFRRPSEPA